MEQENAQIMSMYASANPTLSDHLQPINYRKWPRFLSGSSATGSKKYGGDFIKVFISGSFLSRIIGPDVCYLSDDELEMIIRTAHELNRPVLSCISL
ncbi:MAG: hypothetical protein ACLUUG_12830 [Lachnospiraceae bacterium]